MPLPDTLPPEIWHKIIEIGGFSHRDYRAMLAVAPQTVAKGMHDAAFAALFSGCCFQTSNEDDLPQLMSKLNKYLHPDFTIIRTMIRYLNVRILAGHYYLHLSNSTSYSLALSKTGDRGSCYPIHVLENKPTSTPVICDVLTALPNVTEICWFDNDPNNNRKERRWNCIQSHLPRLTGLTLIQFESNGALDLRMATSLRFLSLMNCRFTPTNDGPWIISGAKIKTLYFKLEYYTSSRLPVPWPRVTKQRLPLTTNIFSGLNLSSLATAILVMPSFSKEEFSSSPPSPNSLSNVGLGPSLDHLRCLNLMTIAYEFALALSNTCSLPSLRSCSLHCSSGPESHNAHTLVYPLRLFLSRQVSIEVLRFGPGVSSFDSRGDTQQDMEEYDAALCSKEFVDMLLLLKNLKFLDIMSYTFSLEHPAFRLEPLAKLEVLHIQSAYTVPLTRLITSTIADKLRLYPALRLFGWYLHKTNPDTELLLDFVRRVKEIAPRMEFASAYGGLFWLRNEDKHEPQKLDYRHPMYRSSSYVWMKYYHVFAFPVCDKYARTWGIHVPHQHQSKVGNQ